MTSASNRYCLRRSILALLFAVAAVFLSSGCASTSKTETPMTMDQVVKMSRNGADAPAIIAKMQETGTVFRLSATSVAMLESEGVPAPVLDYMWQTRWLAERAQADECFRWIWCIMGPPYFIAR